MLPNLSSLPTAVCGPWAPQPNPDDAPPPPPPPSDDGDERYFYLLHRPSDWSSAAPEAVQRIVESGGVVPSYAVNDPRCIPEMRPDDEASFADSIARFVAHQMDLRTRSTHGSVGSVAWFYINKRSGKPALEYAGEDELVFRVPRAWLEHNALSCSETPALRVPLAYRITSTAPLRDEEGRAMGYEEVTNLLYEAHVRENATSRTVFESPPPRPKSPRHEPYEAINPF